MSELKIEVTHRCELRCLHCSSVDDQPVPDMALDDFRAIVDWAHDYGVGKLTISGGEPLLWPSLLRAIEDAKRPSYRRCAPTEEHGSVLDVTLYTSGYPRITEATAKNLQLVGVDRVIFGVHGVTARTYDGITGVAGSCDIATESLGAIQRQGIPCEVHVVPVKPNVREMDGVARVYGAFGVEQVSYLRFVPHGRGQTNHAALELTQDETRVLATHILRTKTRFEQAGYGATKIRVGVPFNILCLDKQAAFNCSAGLYRATIGPDLRVYPCDGFKHTTPEMIGVEGPHPNLRDHDLRWCLDQSEYFKRARQLARENDCRSCENTNACQGGCVAQKLLAGLQATDPDPGCLAEKTQWEGTIRAMTNEEIEKHIETLGGLIATTAAMAITNSATISILAITHQGNCGKATADAHAKQRAVLIALLKEAGVDLPKIDEMNTLTNKAVEDYHQNWEKTGGLNPLTYSPK